jgi:hypothetical protein
LTKKILDPSGSGSDSGSGSTTLIISKKMVNKLSKKRSWLFIPDPDLDFLPILDASVKNGQNLGSGSGFSYI